MRIQDADEKVKAREALVTGGLGDKLKLLSKLLVSVLRHIVTQSNRTVPVEGRVGRLSGGARPHACNAPASNTVCCSVQTLRGESGTCNCMC
jgi:hypothetical protein